MFILQLIVELKIYLTFEKMYKLIQDSLDI